MKKLLFAAVLAASTVHGASVRLPEYDQVAGVSGQVMRVEAKLDASSSQIGGVSGQVMRVDAKLSDLTPYFAPQTCRIRFVIGGVVPTGKIAEDMLAGANVKLTAGNNIYRYPLTSLEIGASVTTFVSVSGTIPAYVELELSDSTSSEQYLYTRTYKTLVEGGDYTIPITLRKADRDLFAIGRAQKIADTTTMQSFLITRDCATTNSYNPVTLFGYYLNNGTTTTWIDETGIRDGHPLITGGDITGEQGDFETRIFPWCEAEKRTVTLNYTPTQGNNNFYFTWIPMYYWKLEDVDLPFRTFNSVTGVWTTNSIPCRVHWISKSPLPGYSLPPWAYIHAYDSGNGTWSTIGVKDGFYYARYDSVTKDSKMQSAPFPTMNTGYTRHDSMTMCHALNTYTSTVTSPTAGILTYPPDTSNRLWAAPMYENYAPFRELAYIQFGASMKSVFYGGSRTNLDSLESAFETAGDTIKSFVTGSGTASNFAWLYIWNPFYGCEGSVMADASYVARKDEAGNNRGEWYVHPDRAADIGGATTVDALDAAGAFALAYTYATTGKTSDEKARCIDQSTLQSAIYWFPGTTTDKCCVRVTDESGWYGSVPSTTGATVYGNWLSRDRGLASRLGLWCVSANSEPSYAYASTWGSRPSFAPLRAEGEARSE